MLRDDLQDSRARRGACADRQCAAHARAVRGCRARGRPDDEGRPDSELLRQRLAGHAGQRGVAALVASDLRYASGQSQLELPFAERRRRLGRVLTDGHTVVISRGLRGEGTTLAEAVSSMGVAEISARLLAAHYRPGARDDAWLRIPVVAETPVATRPLLTMLQRLPL